MLSKHIDNYNSRLDWLLTHSDSNAVLYDIANPIYSITLVNLLSSNQSLAEEKARRKGIDIFKYSKLNTIRVSGDNSGIGYGLDEEIELYDKFYSPMDAIYKQYRYRNKPYFGNTRRVNHVYYETMSKLIMDGRYWGFIASIVPATVFYLFSTTRSLLVDIISRNADIYHGTCSQIYGATLIYKYFKHLIGEMHFDAMSHSCLYSSEHDNIIEGNRVDVNGEQIYLQDPDYFDFRSKVFWLLRATINDDYVLYSPSNKLLKCNLWDLISEDREENIRYFVELMGGNGFYRTESCSRVSFSEFGDGLSFFDASMTQGCLSDREGLRDSMLKKMDSNLVIRDEFLNKTYRNYLYKAYFDFRYKDKSYFGNTRRVIGVLFKLSWTSLRSSFFRGIVVCMLNSFVLFTVLPRALMRDMFTRSTDIYHDDYESIYNEALWGHSTLISIKTIIGGDAFNDITNDPFYAEKYPFKMTQGSISTEQSESSISYSRRGDILYASGGGVDTIIEDIEGEVAYHPQAHIVNRNRARTSATRPGGLSIFHKKRSARKRVGSDVFEQNQI